MWQVILQANMTYHIESLYTSGKYDFMHCYTMYKCHSTQWVNLVMCYCSDSKIFTEYKYGKHQWLLYSIFAELYIKTSFHNQSTLNDMKQ